MTLDSRGSTRVEKVFDWECCVLAEKKALIRSLKIACLYK
jgi:hypothetical protein